MEPGWTGSIVRLYRYLRFLAGLSIRELLFHFLHIGLRLVSQPANALLLRVNRAARSVLYMLLFVVVTVFLFSTIFITMYALGATTYVLLYNYLVPTYTHAVPVVFDYSAHLGATDAAQFSAAWMSASGDTRPMTFPAATLSAHTSPFVVPNSPIDAALRTQAAPTTSSFSSLAAGAVGGAGVPGAGPSVSAAAAATTAAMASMLASAAAARGGLRGDPVANAGLGGGVGGGPLGGGATGYAGGIGSGSSGGGMGGGGGAGGGSAFLTAARLGWQHRVAETSGPVCWVNFMPPASNGHAGFWGAPASAALSSLSAGILGGGGGRAGAGVSYPGRGYAAPSAGVYDDPAAAGAAAGGAGAVSGGGSGGDSPFSLAGRLQSFGAWLLSWATWFLPAAMDPYSPSASHAGESAQMFRHMMHWLRY